MKVYVITSGEYSDYYINAVALTRENAEQICAMLNSPKRHYSDVATIKEYDTGNYGTLVITVNGNVKY